MTYDPSNPCGAGFREASEPPDKDAKAGEPQMVRIEMSDLTLGQLEELMPAITLWAAAEGAPAPGHGDLIALAVATLHAQVRGRTLERMMQDGATARPAMH